MYEKYLEQLEEAGKIRNLKERSINCYKNYVSYFLKYQNKNPEELTCQDVRTFLLAKFEKGRPRGILFPNKFTGNYLTVSTLEQVMRRAVADAELPQTATPHCLRHSFATHLMEQGIERHNIQALLGHRDPKSTEVYLHVSNKSLMGIQSPFDRKDGADHE